MATYSFRLFVLIWAFPDLVSGFQNNRLLTQSLTRTTSKAASKVGRAEWTDDESLTSSRDVAPLRKFNAAFIDNLDGAIGSLITRCALKTVSYYMLEFHDEVNEKWMMGFSNYRKSGQFPDGLWTNYIESMIATDKQRVEVLMTPTKVVLKSRRIPEGSNVMLQYFHDLEPRKIAHQIITVREDVSGEMILDLGCVRLENDEAVRFASAWARDGVDAAEKSRKVTRMREQDESTPLRDGNYMNFDVMITTLAMQLVRDDLVRTKDNLAIQVLDELATKMSDDDDTIAMLEREIHGPRSYMEQLYYRGITDGIGKSGSKTVNILRVAENLFDTRLAIAKEASKLLSLQSLKNRHYYKMIKDYGGFTKLDMSSGVPKITLIDLDLQAVENAKAAAEEASQLKNKSLLEKISSNLKAKELSLASELLDADEVSSNSSTSGPMMM